MRRSKERRGVDFFLEEVERLRGFLEVAAEADERDEVAVDTAECAEADARLRGCLCSDVFFRFKCNDKLLSLFQLQGLSGLVADLRGTKVLDRTGIDV